MKIPYLVFAGLTYVLSTAAFAQETARPDVQRGPPPSNAWTLSVGAGALFAPNYPGDDDYSLSAIPYIRVTKGDRFVASVEEGIRYAVIKQDGFRAGPRISIEFGRQEDGGDTFRIAGNRTTDLIGLGDIDPSLSLGGFAEADFGSFTASANLEQAVTGHKGLTGGFSVNYKGLVPRKGSPIIYSFGPNIKFGDDKYHAAYFGVNAAQSLASGLPAFDASGGVTSVGASATVIVPLSPKITLTLLGSYSRLVDDAANSPLVRQRGSRNQGFAGLVTTYSF